MPLTADVAAQQVQERLRSLHRLVYDIETERSHNEQCIDNILRAEKAAESPSNAEDSSGSSQQQQQLKNLYKAGLTAAEQEERLLRAALTRIYEIRAIKNERRMQARHAGNKETIGCGALMKMLLSAAQTLPLHVGRAGERAPALCGAVPADPGHIAHPGDAVAALVRVSDKEENWILAEVVSWLPAQGKYEVDDIDEEQKNRHVLSKRRVVPLPLQRASPRTDEHALFPKGAVVMALYPQTTCFYRAVVNRLPANAADPYEVLFEDSSYADGYSPPERVAQRYVIAIKEGKGRAT
ncbi:SAGA-associated factor 29 [Ostrinia nubilalis]|uniref:SAGA-associated factor 29 n=1 Tax=Ostrinia nubilalis TaxID=29057 RepID=UPI0010400CA0|nr:SAGA-associated factor 29 isoform X1 [Ostrinia furnacalis]XP_028168973.1 SAGA-associated factor 29 isoform X2 [Ostrinia furnacalis]XP_028168974.1 SAGA-associated factor 29 isoform X1 [Ostrinia furnacalis]XP_028168975.1 SAGA-associated factor 29 isoform X1 [Ostrinia furnacalis]XP_028168976.1 SAGA-associated factor 29 isoform X1 [Ostrinia furnacalis]